MSSRELITYDNKTKDFYLLYHKELIKINVIYRKRKNISIRIIPKDKIDIISPKSVPNSFLKEVIIKKKDWILKTLDKYKNISQEFYEERQFVDGEIFYYLGKEYKLKLICDKNILNKNKNYCHISLHKENIVIKINNYDKELIRSKIKRWYKIESEKVVLSRIEYLKQNNQIIRTLNPNIIKIKEQKKRWGSCTSQKSIYINSRISMARLDVIDYIIIHEFCHLVHMNHSKDFYELVKKIMPNYKKCEIWLKENGYKLII